MKKIKYNNFDSRLCQMNNSLKKSHLYFKGLVKLLIKTKL